MDLNRRNPIFSFDKLKRSDLAGAGVILVLNFLILWIIFGNMLFRLNSVSFAKGGDGVKGYYASLYHVKHDPGYHWSNGMNYPFGEHLFFTDSQPLVTNTIKLVSEVFPAFGDATVGIINSLMLLSILFGAAILYLILRKLGLPMVLAIAAATTITWLSPQLGRLGGHFSLSYITHIPGTILLLMLFAEKPTWWRSLWITLWTLFLALTHFYFYGIVAILLIVFWFRAYVSIPHKEFHTLSKTLHLLLQLIVPLLLVQGYLMLTDPVTDRPGTPWGFMHYRAYPESVLLPVNKPYCTWIGEIISTKHVDWEGYAYTGGIASILFIITVTGILHALFTRRFSKIINPFNHPFPAFLFWAALLALLYSFAVPFVFGLEELLKYLGPIRQMRGVARFAWLFFYAMQILVFFLAWKMTMQRKKVVQYLILSLLILVNGTEAWFNAGNLKRELDNPFTLNTNTLQIEDPEQYQAIVPIPYFHVGSENIWWEDERHLLPHVLNLSLTNGIPTTGVFLSRTSLSQTLQQIGPFIDDNSVLPILQYYDKRPLLLMFPADKEIDPILREALSAGKIIAEKEHYLLASISPEAYCNALTTNHTSDESVISDHETITKELQITDIRSFNRIMERDIAPGTQCVEIRFRVNDIHRDLILRSGIQFVITDHSGNIIVEKWESLGRLLYGINQHDGIFRVTGEIPEGGARILLSINNREMKKTPLTIRGISLHYNTTAASSGTLVD
jgi:hypothetical protein